ncbi:MAG: hypothetical protein K0Q74_383 [Gammaproteobacteria bacterium]|nr:hypothetical protein [Gammaproteobacteria bacterium]
MKPMTARTFSPNIKGTGLGLRACHYAHILKDLPDIPWFEVVTENYMVSGGMVLERLAQIRAHYPIVFHGVGLSIGGTTPLNAAYLSQLKGMVDRFEPAYVSDHLCWTSLDGQQSHELLPLPYTGEAIGHVVKRIRQVQDFLGQQILIENISNYLTYVDSTLPEWEFLNAIAEQADCFILLDINNIYVNAYNHRFNAMQYLHAINPERVKQYHLAGFLDCGTHLIDTHGAKISKPVLQLYETALQQIGNHPTCIEWDNNIPEFSILLREQQKINSVVASVFCEAI